MSWVAVAIGGSAVLGAATSIYGGKKANEAARDASNAAIAQQREDRNVMLSLLEPQRGLGYGAMSDLATLYNYSLPSYQSLPNVLSGAGGGGAAGNYPGGGAPGSVRGIGSSSKDWGKLVDPLGITGGLLSGRRDPQVSVRDGMVYFDGRKDGGTLYGGHINPYTGEVWVDTPDGRRDEALSAQATAALRSGSALTDKRWGRLNMALTELQRSGWRYDSEAIARRQADANLNPAAPGSAGNPAAAGTAGSPGQPGNMARFFVSPDYQFRVNEGAKLLQNSAAARGGLYSGQTGKALTDWGQQAASQEYGNYFNRLMAMAGLGQAATSQGTSAVGTTGANIGNSIIGAGNARASSYQQMASGVNDAAQGGLSNWLFLKYLKGG